MSKELTAMEVYRNYIEQNKNCSKLDTFFAGYDKAKSEFKEAEGWREALAENPYPENIFPPLSEYTLRKIHKTLVEQLNIPLDRLSAQIGREILLGLRDKFGAVAVSQEGPKGEEKK